MAEEAEEGGGEKRAMARGVVNCEECKKEVAKYKCPACSLRSCSLPCVRAHKTRTSCSGKRDRTGFVPMDSFDDAQLLSGILLTRLTSPNSHDNLGISQLGLFYEIHPLSAYQNAGGVLPLSTTAEGIHFERQFPGAALCQFQQHLPLQAICIGAGADYQLLEEALRKSESARRYRAPFNTRKLEPYDRSMILKRQARRRRINLVILPRGMTKRVDNSSWFCRRRKCIFWRVEWHFHSTDLVLISPSADENGSPVKVLEQQLGRVRTDNMQKIRKFCRKPIEAMRFLVAKQMCKGKQRTYMELDPLEPLGAQLDQMTIIEYPTILVVSPDDDTKFIIIKDRRSMRVPVKVDAVTEKLLLDASVAEGVPYKEEIEEGEIIDD
ncbi:hypothetical protein L7F22_007732 [Adiantum nelumboides]|nr:hypothetical protein [Adiantum nelumboides]